MKLDTSPIALATGCIRQQLRQKGRLGQQRVQQASIKGNFCQLQFVKVWQLIAGTVCVLGTRRLLSPRIEPSGLGISPRSLGNNHMLESDISERNVRQCHYGCNFNFLRHPPGLTDANK